MLNVITVAEAQRLIASTFGMLKMPAEIVPLESAGGRALAADTLALEFVPDFDRSTVDGYALRSKDVFGCSESIPALMTVIGSAEMGRHTSLRLAAGECVYVPTGAEIPAVADCVIMLEDAEVLEDGGPLELGGRAQGVPDGQLRIPLRQLVHRARRTLRKIGARRRKEGPGR